MKNTFTLNKDIKLSLDKLSDQDAGKLFKMIVDFANGVEVKPDNLTLDLVFTPIKNQMRIDFEKQESKSMKMKQVGSLGGKAKAKILAKASKSYQKVANATGEEANVNYKKWTSSEFVDDINANKQQYASQMLKDFFNYWSEKDAKGKMRFQLQKTWETKRRLLTWSKNNFNNSPTTNSSNDYNNSTVKNLQSWNK